MEESLKKIEPAIISIWDDIINNAETYSSEKSVVFNFAWKFGEWSKTCDYDITIDFERPMFDNFSGGKFLDLYIEVDGIKIGLEFKFPKSTDKGGSNKKQVRIKAVNDIKRICHLVNKRKVDMGVFLMLTNERSYTQKGNYKAANDFLIFDNHCYAGRKPFPIDKSDSPEKTIHSKDVWVKWLSLEKNNLYAINPIIVYCDSLN